MPEADKKEQMNEFWDAFLRDCPQTDDFLRVIRNVPRFRQAAWSMMVDGGMVSMPSVEELILLMQHVAELREKIWEILLKRNLIRSDILYVMENVPGYKEIAGKILPPSKEESLKKLEELSAL